MSGLALLSGANALVKRPASIRWKRWRARRVSAALLKRDQREASERTVSITSISRSMGWAKVSWLMRAVMSRALVGTPLLSAGLSLTISVSATGLSRATVSRSGLAEKPPSQ